jgi:hypothetical protein
MANISVYFMIISVFFQWNVSGNPLIESVFIAYSRPVFQKNPCGVLAAERFSRWRHGFWLVRSRFCGDREEVFCLARGKRDRGEGLFREVFFG